MWLRAPGSSTLATAICSSSGRYGTASTICENVCWTLRMSAVSSGDSSMTSGSSVISRDEVGLAAAPAVDLHALRALDEHPQRAVGHLEHARDDADDADVVELLRAGLLELGLTAGDHDEHPVAGEHVVDELDRALLADRQRRQRLGERDGLAQRQDRQRLGQRLAQPDLDLARPGAVGDDVDHGSSISGRGAPPRSIGTLRMCDCGSASGSSTRRMPSW